MIQMYNDTLLLLQTKRLINLIKRIILYFDSQLQQIDL